MIWVVAIALAWVCFTVWQMRADLVLTSDWVKEQIEIKAQKDAQDARLAEHQHAIYLRMVEEHNQTVTPAEVK